MADTNEKKKKKKSKKKVEEEAAAVPDLEPTDAPQEQEWPPQAADEPENGLAQEEEAPVDGAPAEGQAPLTDALDDAPQQIEKRKSPYPVFWNRPKAKMYSMNFDYGETYYSNMMAYLNSKAGANYRQAVQPPKAQSWAERAHKSAKLRYPRQEADLSAMLQSVRSNIRNYDMHHRQYTSKVQSVYGSKAL